MHCRTINFTILVPAQSTVHWCVIFVFDQRVTSHFSDVPFFRCPVFPTSHFSDVPLFRNFKLNVQISNFFFGNFFLFEIKIAIVSKNLKLMKISNIFLPHFWKWKFVSKLSNNILPNSKFVTKYYFDNKNSSIWNFPHFLKFYAQNLKFVSKISINILPNSKLVTKLISKSIKHLFKIAYSSSKFEILH